METPLILPSKSPSRLLHAARIEVAAVGDKVQLQIGNSVKVFDYETALQISQWLRVRAKEAKRNAGDMSRHWSVVGVIEGLKK